MTLSSMSSVRAKRNVIRRHSSITTTIMIVMDRRNNIIVMVDVMNAVTAVNVANAAISAMMTPAVASNAIIMDMRIVVNAKVVIIEVG